MLSRHFRRTKSKLSDHIGGTPIDTSKQQTTVNVLVLAITALQQRDDTGKHSFRVATQNSQAAVEVQ